MTIKPGTKKFLKSLEEANLLSLLIDRILSKGLGSTFKTSDYAKECIITTDEMNEVIEDLANRGILALSDENGSVKQGDAQFTTFWAVEGITINLKATQKGLPGTEATDEEEEEEETEE